MCDQTEVSYLPNDVVWVKLSNVWWPAQVQDETKLDEDVTSGLRKKPLAVVKFFDEDLFEFPKNLNQIYHYNCFKKEEFIKKGLDLCRPSGYREVSENMKKFPLDIKKAEILTGGNPDIINDPKYLPEEKFDYREQFGLKPRKKSSLGSKQNSSDGADTPKNSRVKFSTPISAPSTSRTPETKISNSMKSFSNPMKRSMAMKRVASGIARNENFDKENGSFKFSSKQYYCSYCNYSCTRIGVIIEHYRSHYRGLILPLPTQIPQNYCKIFQSNFLKRKDSVSSTPNAALKYSSEKAVKRKSVEDSTPLKKRKYDPTKKDKTVPTPGSSMAIPVKDIVGSAATPKKRPRKSKDPKSVTVKEPEALDILKDWEDDLEEEVEIKLTDSEVGKTDDAKVEDASKSISDSLPENEQPQQPPQDHKSPASKEKCCFDFEDNDESLNLNKSLKFGQKLPRVITEEKPNVQRLLKELKESKESPSEKELKESKESSSEKELKESKEPPAKEELINEDINAEIENLLKSTEVPKLPVIPKTNLPKPIDKSFSEDSLKPEKEITESNDTSKEPIDKVSFEEMEIQSEDSNSMIQSVTSSQTTVQSASTSLETFADSKKDSVADSPSDSKKKKIEAHKSFEEKNPTNSSKKRSSTLDVSFSENTVGKNSSDLKNFEDITQEACSSKDLLSHDIPKNESKTSSNENDSKSSINSEVDGADIALPSTTVESTLDKDKTEEIFENISTEEEDFKVSFTEEEVPNNIDDSIPMEVEIDSHEEIATFKSEEEQGFNKQNDGLQSIQNISISEAKSSNENNEKTLKETETNNQPSEVNKIPIDDTIKIQVVTSSVKNDKAVKVEPSTSSDIQNDQIPFDINSMPIVIDQDPIMEIMEGHVEALPNADVVRLYIRNSGEEEPEDFQSPRRLLTVSPPPPNLPPIPGIKKVPLPPPKNKNGSNKISGNATSGSSTRYTLSKQPGKNASLVQQPKILFIKSTSGAPGKLLIPQQQSNIFAQAGKLQPGTRILTTNPQMVSKGSVQKKVTPKSIVVGKQGFPTTAKVVPKSVIGQVIQKVSQQPIICNKNSSTVLVNAPKTIVNRSVGRNVLLSSQQLKTTTAMQVTGAKVVRTAQVVKAPSSVFQQAETILPQKVVQSTSALNENKKQVIKNKQISPNILQRTQRKGARQQVIKKSQLLTIPSSVQQQSAEVVTVNNLPIVQSISSHSSSEPVKMLYLVDNSQYTVESPVIPVENDNQNIYVTSTSSSGNLDNIIFSIDGTANFVNISNDTATSSSTHIPSQDILAKALANTQVLQSETADIDSENTVYVDQQFQAPSLSNTVLETSLTLNQPPIMTPLEVPSSIAPQSNVSHIIPISSIAKKADIQQPSMPLLTDDDVSGNTVFLSDSSAIPTTSGHLTFQLVHDNNLVVSSGIMQDKSLKLNSDSKEDNVLPEFLKGNFGSKSDIPKKEPSPKRSER